jgi:urate oxidase
MAIVLGSNRYGKAEVRLVHVERSTPVHVITDINVTSQLIGDFSDSYYTGANDKVIATDTQKNTVYALARKGGVPSIEEFGLRLARNFVGAYDTSAAPGWRSSSSTGTGSRRRTAHTTIRSSRARPWSATRWYARTAVARS